MNKEELIKLNEKFAEGKDFKVTDNPEHLDMLMEGLIINEQKYGARTCPCRAYDEKDRRFCPCKFKEDEIWEKEGRCWCGLFLKR